MAKARQRAIPHLRKILVDLRMAEIKIILRGVIHVLLGKDFSSRQNAENWISSSLRKAVVISVACISRVSFCGPLLLIALILLLAYLRSQKL